MGWIVPINFFCCIKMKNGRTKDDFVLLIWLDLMDATFLTEMIFLEVVKNFLYHLNSYFVASFSKWNSKWATSLGLCDFYLYCEFTINFVI